MAALLEDETLRQRDRRAKATVKAASASRIGKEHAMDAIRLGMTDFSVSPIALGTWELGGEWGTFSEQRAIKTIRRARELGINLFDTAQGYGFGASERLLGRALRAELDTHRETIVIATKGGLRMTGDGLVRDAS